jgi:hypothetical protein
MVTPCPGDVLSGKTEQAENTSNIDPINIRDIELFINQSSRRVGISRL